MNDKRLRGAAIALAAGLLACQAAAQSTTTLKSVVERALATNPEVAARYHAFRAASDSVEVARSGRLPRLDLTADIGYERATFVASPRESLSRSGFGLSLTQVLWDGLGTRNEIDRVDHERLSRYFELIEVTEQTALEAARALYDVARYRQFVALAEDNFVQHRLALDKIQSRVRAGVGRGVDLEQAIARVALAESNLTSEVANLHDVSARYQRIVGELPADDRSALVLLDEGMPASATDALRAALAHSPAISASIESLRAARSAVKTRESATQPRVEARVRTGGGHNYNAIVGRRTDSVGEIVLNWNLFDGGADRARVQQQANVVNQAVDLRDKACRDARQVAAIAYNDAIKLNDQLIQLGRNTQAIERARDAYRQQFDIGQRSLLDLLNSENETYTARRALANAQYDRALAYARTHAALNQLGARLGITRGGQADEAPGWSAGDDAAGRCPIQAVEIATVDAAALSRRAEAAAAAAPAAAAVADTPAGPVTPRAAPAPTAAARPRAEVLATRVVDWADAWRSKDFERYTSFYAPGFLGSETSTEAWKAKRRKMLAKKGTITLTLQELTTAEGTDGQVETRFRQRYASPDFRDTSRKVLTWKQIDGQWLITGESNR